RLGLGRLTDLAGRRGALGAPRLLAIFSLSDLLAEPPQRFLFLEIQRADRRWGDPADPFAEVAYPRPHVGIGQHPHAECERRRADVVLPFQLERQRDRAQLRLAEPPVAAVL